MIGCHEKSDDKYINMTIEEKILANDDNASFFKHFGINPKVDTITILHKSKSGNYYYHEALADFWDIDGKSFPDSIKLLVNGNGVLVCPNNGKIFAFQFGQRDFAFRYDFSSSDFENSDDFRILRNLDGIEVDLRDLGEDWVLGIHFLDDTEKELVNSYNKNVR